MKEHALPAMALWWLFKPTHAVKPFIISRPTHISSPLPSCQLPPPTLQGGKGRGALTPFPPPWRAHTYTWLSPQMEKPAL